MSFQWTPETIETVQLLQATGMSASQIATAIGAPSRCAVLGKVFRIRHPLLNRPSRAKPRKAKPPMKVISATPMHFLAATDGRCRFPLWQDARSTPIASLFFCGDPAGIETYCDHHASRCFGIGSRGERNAHKVERAAA